MSLSAYSEYARHSKENGRQRVGCNGQRLYKQPTLALQGDLNYFRSVFYR